MLKCYYKPTRSHPRFYTHADAARVLCYAVRGAASVQGKGTLAGAQGGTFERQVQQIVAVARARCGDEGFKRFTEAAAEAAAVAEESDSSELSSVYDALIKNVALLDQLLSWFGALMTFLTVLIGVARFVPIPAVRLVSVGASRILSRVSVFQGTIIARKAANDQSIERIRVILEARKLRLAA